jgi:hypothetical protein
MSNSDFHYDGFSAPNYTQVPDDVFDVLAPQLSEAELRVLLYIIRRTFGFKKHADSISLKQLVEGIRTHDGRVLDSGAGVAKSSAVRAVKGLVEKGIVAAQRNQSRERGFEATTYALRFKSDPLSHHETRGASSPVKQALVSPRNIQETVLQETDVEISKFERPTHELVGDEDEPVPARRAGAPSGAVEPQEQANNPVRAAAPPPDVAHRPGTDALHALPSENPAFRRFKDEALKQRAELVAGATKAGHRGERRLAATEPIGAMLAERVDALAERIDLDAPVAPAEQAPAVPPDAPTSPSLRRGRPPGSREERDILTAYLADFAKECNDQAPLPATVTRAYRLFAQAGIPKERYPAFLYQCRSIVKERSAQITKTVADPSTTFRAKNKMPYYLAVLSDLIGLKTDGTTRPSPSEQGP